VFAKESRATADNETKALRETIAAQEERILAAERERQAAVEREIQLQQRLTALER